MDGEQVVELTGTIRSIAGLRQASRPTLPPGLRVDLGQLFPAGGKPLVATPAFFALMQEYARQRLAESDISKEEYEGCDALARGIRPAFLRVEE